jgi:hypothetical protein
MSYCDHELLRKIECTKPSRLSGQPHLLTGLIPDLPSSRAGSYRPWCAIGFAVR